MAESQTPKGKKHLPVDRLFMTLAEGLGELSVGVILSGTDGDGSTGAEHIKAAGGVTFAIVSDIAMPTQDGIDLVRQIRALDGATGKVPMIALTAFTSDDDRRRILGAGFNAYLTKPVAPLELMRLVANLKDDRASRSTTT